MSNSQSIIYFDAAATTQCADDITKAMEEFSSTHYGNSSSSHTMGRLARQATIEATNNISQLLGCSYDELTLTSGATESNNIVVLGCIEGNRNQNIVICPIDHKSTLAAASEMKRRGIEIRYMKVDNWGRINLDHLAQIIDGNTALVSLSYVNSEIGTIQDLSEIGSLVKKSSALFHIDAAQAAGKIKINVKELGIDCASLSAHKIYGPKGIGALYSSSVTTERLRPLTFGGGQYRLRSGTLPTQLVVGFGLAAKHTNNIDLASIWSGAEIRRKIILDTLNHHNIHYQLNSPESNTAPHILNISIVGIRSETIINSLPLLCVSSGSACNSDNLAPSHVITGIGHCERRANCAIRFSFPGDMNIEQVHIGAEIFAAKVGKLQKLQTGVQ